MKPDAAHTWSTYHHALSSGCVTKLCATADGKQLLTGASTRLKTYDTNSGAGTPGRTLTKVCPYHRVHVHKRIPLTRAMQFAIFSEYALLQDATAVAHAPRSGLTASGDAGGQVCVLSPCCMRFMLQFASARKVYNFSSLMSTCFCQGSVSALLSGHCVEQQQPDCVDIPACAASHCTGFQQLC